MSNSQTTNCLICGGQHFPNNASKCVFTEEDLKRMCVKPKIEREIFYDYNDTIEDVDRHNERTGGGYW